MKFVIVSGNPKTDGLCAAITDAVKRGAADGGAEVQIIVPDKIERCHVCGDGWGTCRNENRQCAFGGDGFNELRATVEGAEALCFVTPVYWGETSELMKCFIDRLRRCDAPFMGNGKGLAGKQTLLVVSAGGSGNGLITALEQLERFCQHTAAPVFDRIMQNRWNADYMQTAAYSAAKAIAEGRKQGDNL